MRKRKLRGQKKALNIGIISSVLLLGFVTGITVSALNLPHREELDAQREDNNLLSVNKLKDNYYLLTATTLSKEEENKGAVIDGIVYIYDNNDILINKTSIFSDVKEKFGIDNLSAFSYHYICEDTDSFYVASQNYLFRYTGINEHDLTLVSYCSDFEGAIVTMASSETDLYVLSRDGNQYRIDRFDVNDASFTKKSSGHVYETNSKSDRYSLVCSKSLFIYSTDVIDDYLYITTNTYVRKIHRDMKCNNYRVLFEDELKAVTSAHPELSLNERRNLAKENCITNYGWLDFNLDNYNIDIPKNALNPKHFSFYILPELAGAKLYNKETFYFADKLGELYYFTLDELNAFTQPVNYLEDELNYDGSFSFPYRLNSTTANCFSYFGVGKTCIVFYQEGNQAISILDFSTRKLLYTIDVSTRIGEAFYNEETDKLYYKYQDPVNRESGVNYLSTCNVEKELGRKLTRTLLVTFSILAGVCLIVASVSWVSYCSEKATFKVVATVKGLKKHWIIYVILFPSIFILCLFCYYPGIAAIYTSFFDYKAGISDIKTWNNFGNYVEIFGNKQSLLHFINMTIFLLADVVLAIAPPLIFAFFLTLMRHKKLSGVLRTLLFIPGIIPGIAGLLIWRTGIYGDYGLVNNIIKAAGGSPIYFFKGDNYVDMLWLILMGFPFVGSYLIFYGAMMNIPSSYYEAAEMDGITVWKRFFKIDLPLCIPQIKYILIMTIIASIQNFSRIYVAMGGASTVISTPIVEMYMLMNSSERNYGLASAYATILFVILFGLTYLSMRNRLKEK